MKLKIDLDIDAEELIAGLAAGVRTATDLVYAEAVQHAKQLAAQKLGSSGQKHWNEGFKAHKVNDDLWVISIEGKMASWMEDGIQTGEISKAIMNGNRASHNKAEGKDYVDVPFLKDADASGNIKGTNVNVKAFADADSLVKNVKFSDYKNKSVKEEKRVISRVQDIIKSVNPQKQAATSFLTIRRVTSESVWPSSPFKGAKILDDLDQFIDQRMSEILGKVL